MGHPVYSQFLSYPCRPSCTVNKERERRMLQHGRQATQYARIRHSIILTLSQISPNAQARLWRRMVFGSTVTNPDLRAPVDVWPN